MGFWSTRKAAIQPNKEERNGGKTSRGCSKEKTLERKNVEDREKNMRRERLKRGEEEKKEKT